MLNCFRCACLTVSALCAAVPASAQVYCTTRVIAEDDAGNRLSDHDAYTTEVTLA